MCSQLLPAFLLCFNRIFICLWIGNIFICITWDKGRNIQWEVNCWESHSNDESPSNDTKCWWRCWTMTETLTDRFGSVHWYKRMGKLLGNIFNVKYSLTLWFNNSRFIVLPEHFTGLHNIPKLKTSWCTSTVCMYLYTVEYYIISKRSGMCNNTYNANKNTTQRKKARHEGLYTALKQFECWVLTEWVYRELFEVEKVLGSEKILYCHFGVQLCGQVNTEINLEANLRFAYFTIIISK